MTNAQVAQAFATGQPARAGNLVSTGSHLFSYAYILAARNDDGTVTINTANTGRILNTCTYNRYYDAAYSPTTNKHRTLVAQACGVHNVRYADINR